MVISFVFYTYLCLIFVDFFFKSIRKMSTALKKTHCYSSLTKLCNAATRKYRPKSGNTTTSADAECTPGPIS